MGFKTHLPNFSIKIFLQEFPYQVTGFLIMFQIHKSKMLYTLTEVNSKREKDN